MNFIVVGGAFVGVAFALGFNFGVDCVMIVAIFFFAVVGC